MSNRHYRRGARPGGHKPQSAIVKSLSAVKDVMQFLCFLVLVCLNSCRFKRLDFYILGAPVLTRVVSVLSQSTKFICLLILLRSIGISLCRFFSGLILTCKTIRWDCQILIFQFRQMANTLMQNLLLIPTPSLPPTKGPSPPRS